MRGNFLFIQLRCCLIEFGSYYNQIGNNGGSIIKEYLEVKRLILERTQLEGNDPKINDYWHMIVDSFGDNEQTMIDILNMCSEFEIDWLREIYDDLAYKFPSKNILIH